jgi:hypothetical protein
MIGTYIFFLINTGIAIIFFMMEGAVAKVVGVLLLLEGAAYVIYKWLKVRNKGDNPSPPN